MQLDAPAGCAIAEPITREVERLLRPTKTDSKPLDVKLSVVRKGPERFRLIIETSDDDKGRFRRELESSNCRDFIRPTAVIIALAINPKALEALDSPPEPSSKASAGPAEPALKPTTEPSPPKLPNAERAPTESASKVERGTLAEAPLREQRQKIIPFARAALVIDFGALPAAGIGPALGGGIGWRWLRVEASGVYLLARRATLSASPQKGGDIELIAAALSVCGVPYRARAELGGCLGSDVGVLAGEGFGVSNPQSGNATWLAAKAGVLAGYTVHRGFVATFHADIVRRIGNAEFELQGLGAVHKPAAWGARLDSGLEFRFE